jgi:hypothetical protein
MQIINSTDINVNGTSKQSTFRATYWELVEAFGCPTYRGPEYLDDKLNVEWVLQVDGEPATIYDWKSSIPHQKTIAPGISAASSNQLHGKS